MPFEGLDCPNTIHSFIILHRKQSSGDFYGEIILFWPLTVPMTPLMGGAESFL